MSKYKLNFPNNTYKRGNIYNVDNQTDYFIAENKTLDFSELFQVSTDINEAVDLTDGGIIKSVIS